MTTSRFAFEHSGKTLELSSDETLIGSSADCAVQIEGKNIEPVHAAVVLEAGNAVLRVRAESEDVRVNGKPTRVEDLEAGDKIRIGEVEFSAAAGDPLPVLEGPGGPYQLKSGENTVGRAGEAAVSLDDDSVSREHASILALPSGRVRIRDLGSSNGTFVNDRRLGEIELTGGDKVEIGGERLVFIQLQMPAGADAESPPSPPAEAGDSAPMDMDKTRIAADLPDLAALAESAAEPEGPTFELVVSGETRTLGVGDHKIGRAPDCSVQFTDDSEVSRYHAQLTVAADKVTVRDLDSSNGTRVNGQKIDREVVLANGDQVGVGGKEMTFKVTGPVDLMGKTVMAEDVLASLGHTVLAPLGDMTAIEALKNLPEEQRNALNLLELDPSAGEEGIRSRFKELYSEFQVRTTNAPTPELRKKYERRVEELRQAVEVLVPPEASSADLPSSEPVEAPVGDEAIPAAPPPAESTEPSVEVTAVPAPPAPPKAKKKPKVKKEKAAGEGLPGSAWAMMAVAVLAAVGSVVIYLLATGSKNKEAVLQIEYDTMVQNIATMREQNPQTQEAIVALEGGKATLLENYELKICNLSQGPIDVSWWQVSYVGPDNQIRSFNSADYGYPNWRIEAGQTGKNSYTVDDQTLWDGSAVFFSATVNYRGRETLRSGALQAIGPDCYNLRLD